MSTYLDRKAYDALFAEMSLLMTVCAYQIAAKHQLTLDAASLEANGVDELRDEFCRNIMWHGLDVWPDDIPEEDR